MVCMKNFKIVSVIFAVIGVIFFAHHVFAADNSWFGSTFDTLQHTAGASGYGANSPMDPRRIVANIVKIVLGLVATILFGLNVYAGFLWMTASGNEDKVSQAKNIIRDATIGLIVVLSAYGITIAVTNIALGRSLGSGANQGTTIEGAIQNGNWW